METVPNEVGSLEATDMEMSCCINNRFVIFVFQGYEIMIISLMSDNIFAFTTCDDILATLSRLMKKRRLEKDIRTKLFKSNTGVSAPTIERFETSSRISLVPFVKLAADFGHQDELLGLLEEDKYSAMEEMATIKMNKRIHLLQLPCSDF